MSRVFVFLFAILVIDASAEEMTRSKWKAAELQVERVAMAFDAYKADCGEYPSDEFKDELLASPRPCAKPPYLKARDFVDPWGRPLDVSKDSRRVNGVRVASGGADANFGTVDDIIARDDQRSWRSAYTDSAERDEGIPRWLLIWPLALMLFLIVVLRRH